MPDIGKVLKDEIARISKREVKSLVATHIKTIRSLKQQVAELKKQIGKPAITPAQESKPDVATGQPGKSVWFTSKGIQGMRKRLGLTRAQMADLCGVSANAVGLWEGANAGKLNLHTKTRNALIKLRQMTPAAVKKALAAK
jgi:DNA-binding transcriptional regulator YiaG